MRRCLALVVLLSCHAHREAGPEAGPRPTGSAVAASAAAALPPPAERPPPPLPPGTDWCIDGLSALTEDVCYVLPQLDAGAPRRLLVYLPGIVPPQPDSPQKRSVETAVLHAVERAGFAALVPRGRRGIGPGEARDWWAWPTTPAAIDALSPSIVAGWAAAKRRLEAAAGGPFEKTYLAGSSNGAYFLVALVVRGGVPTADFPVDGYGAMSGGGAGTDAAQRLAEHPARPFYVGFGTYDEETKARAQQLIAGLKAARWPLRAAEHAFGHGAREIYLDEAIAFWSVQANGP